MRFTTLLLSTLPLLALATEDLVDPVDGAAIDVTTVTSTQTHLKLVTATGEAPTETPKADSDTEGEEEEEVKVLYTVTQVPDALVIAQNTTAAPTAGLETSEPAGNFTRTPTASGDDDVDAPEETKKPGESAAGRREVVWGVLVGGLVGASIMGF